MAKANRTFRSDATADTSLVTTAETVIATLAGVTTKYGSESVRLRGWAQITAGTATTAITLRIRRSSVTGTLVGEANPIQGGVAAASTSGLDIATTDTPGDVAGQTYVLTAQQTAATGNGTALQASLEAAVG